MPRTLRRSGATVVAAALVSSSLLIAAPAYAAPWDGSDVDFGPAKWDFESSDFYLADADLIYPGPSYEYTDVWDTAGLTTIVSDQRLIDEYVSCDSDADVDIEVEAATGDLVLTCVPGNLAFTDGGLGVVSEIRVLAGGQIVRFTTTITNTGADDVVVDAVFVYTDFGSSGDLYDYDNQSDAILPVPAPESGDLTPALNDAAAEWIVHWETDDAPSGFVIGGGSNVAAPATWSLADGDEYEGVVGPFTIPVGASRSVVSFVTWDPQTLINGEYTNNSPLESLLDASADQIVAGMAQFADPSGALLNGLDPASPVVNWGPVDTVVEPEEPELADTGAGDALALGLGAMVLLGIGGLLVVRRRATV